MNIGGEDIIAGNKKLVLGMSWQLMRISILQNMGRLQLKGKAVDEEALVAWANEKVGDKAPAIANMQDKSLSDSVFLLHLMAAVRPEAIDWEEVKRSGSDEDKHENASYLINMARKIGTPALPSRRRRRRRRRRWWQQWGGSRATCYHGWVLVVSWGAAWLLPLR